MFAELGEVVNGAKPALREKTTVFKSLGKSLKKRRKAACELHSAYICSWLQEWELKMQCLLSWCLNNGKLKLANTEAIIFNKKKTQPNTFNEFICIRKNYLKTKKLLESKLSVHFQWKKTGEISLNSQRILINSFITNSQVKKVSVFGVSSSQTSFELKRWGQHKQLLYIKIKHIFWLGLHLAIIKYCIFNFTQKAQLLKGLPGTGFETLLLPMTSGAQS